MKDFRVYQFVEYLFGNLWHVHLVKLNVLDVPASFLLPVSFLATLP